MTEFDEVFGRPPEEGEPEPLGDPAARLGLSLNDRDNAVRLHSVLSSEMFWAPGPGWHVWRGAHFDAVGGREMAISRAGCLQRLVEEEARAAATAPVPKASVEARAKREGETAAEAEAAIREGRRRGRMAYATGCGNAGRIKAALEMGQALFRRELGELDADRALLQCANGTLDLMAAAGAAPEAEEPEERLARMRAALAVPPRRDHWPTKVAGCEFDPEARCPGWERFVQLAMPDPFERAYLQRVSGLMLLGQRNEVCFILLGPGGNGKSTYVKAVEGVLGGYAQACRIEMFCEQKVAHTGPTPEEAVLPGARVYLASEPETSVTLSAAKIKGLTGSDTRQANPKNKDLFSYRPVGIPVLQANRMPNVNDPSEGFWRRIFPVIFDERLADLPEGQRMDTEAVAAMLEAERAGILNWMIAGLAEYLDLGGLHPPDRVRALKGELRALSDPVGEFLESRCETGMGFRVVTSDLHAAFKAWSEKRGEKPMGGRAFAAALIAKGFGRQKSSDWYWLGLALRAGVGEPGE